MKKVLIFLRAVPGSIFGRDGLFRDYDGYIRDGWLAVAIVSALLVVVASVIVGPCKVGSEAGCNQRGSEVGAIHSDYRLWSDTCYLTAPNGQVIPADSYRFVQRGEGF